VSEQEKDDPIVAALREHRSTQKRRTDAHADLRASQSYSDQSVRLRRILAAFLGTLQQSALVVTRWERFTEHSFLLRHFDDIGEAAVMATLAIENGALNPARREMRHMLEVTVSAAYVDETVSDADFDGRVAFFKSGRVSVRNVDQVAELPFRLLGGEKAAFIQATKDAWVHATHYVHPTKKRLDEKLRLRAGGIALGFETPEMVTAVIDDLFRVFGLIIVLTFETIGPMFTGDLMVDGLDNDDTWPFHADRYVAQVDAHFDYKFERQAELPRIRQRRESRLAPSAATLPERP
jgi:hypothetical protein